MGPLRCVHALLPSLKKGSKVRVWLSAWFWGHAFSVDRHNASNNFPKTVHPHTQILLMTSRMGSIADNTSGASYGYRMSKAALQAAGKSLALDLKPRGVAVCILHPGFVKTGRKKRGKERDWGKGGGWMGMTQLRLSDAYLGALDSSRTTIKQT